MRRVQIVAIVMLASWFTFFNGCSSQPQPVTPVPGTSPRSARNPSATTNNHDSEKGVVGTTGEAIGTVVLFPFRAIGDAFTPPDKERK